LRVTGGVDAVAELRVRETGEPGHVADGVARWEPSRAADLDEAGFEQFFRDHHRVVYVFALHMVGDAGQAEDIASDVLVKVFLRWRRGGVDQPRAYLRRAVVNHVNSWLRRKQVERRYLERQHAGGEPADAPLADRLGDAQVLTTALGRLPARQRAAVVLRFYDDLSEAETAQVLGCSVGTVKSQVHRGLAKLRDLVGPDVLTGGPA